ncbi:hypothetical protein [Spirosoma sp. 209]|uniref:hypothetical protein n=1 Tax=Spirosoma sp. 209 TaxID=1955701 RepID=UPI00098D54D2|nr:hypothetical protein [Spirosoma sp. 209]PHK37187.1 hypothetical protein VF13_36795 [Nostoc linckia z16]
MRKYLILYAFSFYTCFCHAQKITRFIGTYFSKDTLQPVSLILKPGDNKSISGILITAIGQEYTYFTHQNDTLTGYFIPSQPDNYIKAIIKGDSLELFIMHNDLTKHLFLSKLKNFDSELTKNKQFDQVLFGRWVYYDEKQRKLINTQYFVFYPDGKLEFSHAKHPDIMNSDIIKSGKVKPKWATQNQHLHLLFETSLPLYTPSIPASIYRIGGDTLYMTNKSGRVHKAVRDKSFIP